MGISGVGVGDRRGPPGVKVRWPPAARMLPLYYAAIWLWIKGAAMWNAFHVYSEANGSWVETRADKMMAPVSFYVTCRAADDEVEIKKL